MKKDQFLHLIDKYLSGQASEEEEQQLIRFFNSFQADEAWSEEVYGVKQALEEKMLQRLMQSVQHDHPAQPPVKIKALSRWRMAAAVALLLAAGGAFYYNYTTHKDRSAPAPSIVAGKEASASNKAILKLGDGTTIELEQAANGVVAMQGNTVIKKTKDGQLIYEAASSGQGQHRTLNTITTPAGGQYQLTLPDGTRVWLNAGTSLTFPAVFEESGRQLELKGEAYFEVAKVYKATANGRVSMPFYVKAGANEVAVLGTHFNVMAYDDAEVFETTLLEGAVNVKHGKLEQNIQPGQQAVITANSTVIKVRQVNTEAVMAWKEGLFLFDNTNIDDAMQQIRRWYNMKVIYEGSKPDVEFTGVLPRSSSVAEVLDLLESAQGVQFSVSGNNIIVKRK